MKRFQDIVHNTNEWYAARAGLATTSTYDRVITASGKPSSQIKSFAHKIMAERLLNKPYNRDLKLYALEWGKQYEDEAANLYCFEQNVDIEHGGFFTNDDMTQGSSPDVVVLQDGNPIGAAEIKCPENPEVHMEFLLQDKINPKYKAQVFGQMIVTGFDWVDWFSYYPGLPSACIRTHRSDDPDFASALEKGLQALEDTVQKGFQTLIDRGQIEKAPEKKIKQAKKESESCHTHEDYLMAG